MEPVQFLKGRTRETKIRRDARGRWFNDGDAVDHPNLVRCFDGWVDRAEDGRFCLSNDINWAYVAIEGAAYWVRDVDVVDDALRLRLSGGREEVLDLGRIRQDSEGTLWCTVREGRCPARFDNHASSKLADLMGEDDHGIFLEVGSHKVHPPVVENPLELGAQQS